MVVVIVCMSACLLVLLYFKIQEKCFTTMYTNHAQVSDIRCGGYHVYTDIMRVYNSFFLLYHDLLFIV